MILHYISGGSFSIILGYDILHYIIHILIYSMVLHILVIFICHCNILCHTVRLLLLYVSFDCTAWYHFVLHYVFLHSTMSSLLHAGTLYYICLYYTMLYDMSYKNYT